MPLIIHQPSVNATAAIAGESVPVQEGNLIAM